MADNVFMYRIEWMGRLLLAQASIIIFLLLNLVSFSMPHAGDFKPFFLLMAVFYWAVYRPTLMPIPYTFALGLIMDLQGGLPIGLSALVLVGLQNVVRSQRLFLTGQAYIVVWLGFVLVAFANAFALWSVISLFSWQMMPIVPTLLAAVISVVIFPLASLILLGVHRILPLPASPYIR
jgi:rod shape-determining protein MreD